MLLLHSTAPLAAFTVHCLQLAGQAVDTQPRSTFILDRTIRD